MAVELPGSEEEGAAHRLIEQASAALHDGKPAIPANFAAHLFARVVPEDLVRYSAADLARLAAGMVRPGRFANGSKPTDL